MEMPLLRAGSVGYMVNLAGRLLVKEMDLALSAHGLSTGQLPVFFALGRGEAMTQRQLVRHAQVEQPTMAATLARMDRDGLVSRAPNPADGRSELVSLSALGLEKVAAVRDCAAAVNGKATSGMAAGEREQLLTLLARVADNLSPS